MTFFEPLPSEPPAPERRWAAPLWDRPSEGTVPVVVPVNELVARTDELVVAVELLRVYPNGFTVGLAALGNPHADDQRTWRLMGLGGGGPRSDGLFPRVGIRFADGRTGGRAVQRGVDSRDDRGIPTQPIVSMIGAGGGSGGTRMQFWIFPLPPPGPFDVVVGVPALGDLETTISLDGDLVIAAAQQATVIWE